MAHVGHGLHCWVDDLIHHAVAHGVGHHRRGAIGPHTASVGAGVAFAHGLVVLGRCKRQRVFTVAQHEEACFLTCQEFFHNHFRACSTKRTAEDVVDGFVCFLNGPRQDHALACGQAIRLDHDWRALLGHIGLGVSGCFEPAVCGGRDIVFCTDILGEAFGPFKLGCACRGAKCQDVCFCERIHKARHQRVLRAYHNKIDRHLAAEIDHGVKVCGLKVHTDCHVGNAAIAGRTIERIHQRALGNFPAKGMFAAT